MGTPRGAEHRDGEQRFKDLETKLNRLATVVLGQRQLSVTDGDFVVSGGDGILVKDGGGIVSEHPNGQTGLEFGPVTPDAFYDHGLTIRTDDGLLRAYFAQTNDGHFDAGIGSPNVARNIGLIATNSVQAGTRGVTSGVGLGANSLEFLAGSFGALLDANGGGEIVLGGTCNAIYITHATTGSAANCRIESTGRIYRVTSSLRYKQDVEDAVVDPADVLAITGRTWRGRDDVENLGDDAPRNVGFIAEELHDAGLGLFVEYDNEGRPDAIQYDRLTVALLAVAKDQQTQLDLLTERMDAMEGTA